MISDECPFLKTQLKGLFRHIPYITIGSDRPGPSANLPQTLENNPLAVLDS